MAFHDVRFPTSVSLGASGGPERRTEIVVLGSGHEERNSRWADSKRSYNAGYGIKSVDDLHAVIAFFEERNEASAERIAQTRLAITDGAYGKPWIYKPKAIQEWWQNQHHNRPGGVEAGSPTAWVPQSKPIWFTEVGCPAVDKGANQPNVFIDPKSAESLAPYFSRSVRDDLMQRRYIQAILGYFDPANDDYVAGSNPVSGVYGGRMVDASRIFIYTWDARPYPAFPYALSVWADGGNWELGHWLTGRVGGGALASIVRQILEDYGFARYEVTKLYGFLDGFVIDRIMSVRDALQPLGLAYLFDAYESGGLIQFAHRGLAGSVATVTPDDLVETDADAPLYTLTRGQETELPLSAKVTYIDGNHDYAQGAVEARRLGVRSDRVSAAELPIVMGQGKALAIAEGWLRDAWAARAAALTRLDGLLVNNAAITLRFGAGVSDTASVDASLATYVGTFRATADGQTEDSGEKRLLWNAYNRASAQLRRQDTTDTWTYSTGAYHQANASAANQVAMVRGLDEDVVVLSLINAARNASTSTLRPAAVAVGLDSTTAKAADCVDYQSGVTSSSATNETAFGSSRRRLPFPRLARIRQWQRRHDRMARRYRWDDRAIRHGRNVLSIRSRAMTRAAALQRMIEDAIGRTVLGVSIGRWDDRSTWRINLADATDAEREAARTVFGSFDPTAVPEITPKSLDDVEAEIAALKAALLHKGMVTEAEIDARREVRVHES